uniref:RCK C-terminal domain-containing protein n=1 Tax=Ditylenchus dipsaci TaxID=166011 RepID=A0A915D868_9BILA
MLDRLLYQSFLKNYLVDFIKILLGMDQSPGSGYLSSLTITEEDLWIRNYGCLYQKLCAYAADVPIGIFRSEKMKKSTSQPTEFDSSNNEYISQLVLQRLQALGLSAANYIAKNLAGLSGSKEKTVSYVIINPSADLQLNAGDVVYILRAPSLLNEKAQLNVPNPKVGLRRSLKLTKQAGNLSSLASDK